MLLNEHSLRHIIKRIVSENYRRILQEEESVFDNLSVDSAVNKVKSNKNQEDVWSPIDWEKEANEFEGPPESQQGGQEDVWAPIDWEKEANEFEGPPESQHGEPEDVWSPPNFLGTYPGIDKAGMTPEKIIAAGTFIVPPLKRGYYDMARILINNTKELNQKMLDKGFGFTNQDYNSFKEDLLLYKDEIDLATNCNLQEIQSNNLTGFEDLFAKSNQILSNEAALARLLQKYFSDKLLHPKNKINMAGFINFAKLNALKIAAKNSGLSANDILTDEASLFADDVYQDFIKDKGSLSKFLQAKKAHGKVVFKWARMAKGKKAKFTGKK